MQIWVRRCQQATSSGPELVGWEFSVASQQWIQVSVIFCAVWRWCRDFGGDGITEGGDYKGLVGTVCKPLSHMWGVRGESEEKLWLAGFSTGAIALVAFGPGLGRVVCCVWLLKGMVHWSPSVFNSSFSSNCARCLSASEHVAQETAAASLLEAFAHSPCSSPDHLCPGPVSQPVAPGLSPALWWLVAEALVSLLCQTAGQSSCPPRGVELGGRKTMSCSSRSCKRCHHGQQLQCGTVAAHHLQKLISEEKHRITEW